MLKVVLCSFFKFKWSFFRCSGNGGTQTCLPAARGMAQGVAQYDPSSSTHAQDPRVGPSLVGGRRVASSGIASSGWLARRRRDQGRVPCKVPVMQAMTIETRRALACAGCLFPLWCKGGKHRRRVPRHQAKVAISMQRDQDQQRGRMEVTVEPKTASQSESLAVKD